MATPREALAALRAMAASGELDDFCARHALALLVAFGGATQAEDGPEPRDLDLAVAFCPDAESQLVSLVTDLMGLLHLSAVDVLDLDRAGIVAADQALRLATPLYERSAGEFARRQMTAVSRRLDTAWLRRMSLELMAT